VVGKAFFINSLADGVDDGVAGVGLDGGEDGLTGGSSSSKGSGDCGSGKSGRDASGKSSREASIAKGSEGSSDRGGGVDVGNNLARGSGVHTRGEDASSVGVDGDDGGGLLLFSLTPLSLFSRGSLSSRLGSGKSLSMGSSGSSDLSSLLRSHGKGKVKDGSGKRGNSRGSGSNRGDREVGGRDSESVDGVRDVLGSLEDSVGINILVGASGHSIGIPGLRPGTWAASVAERELSELVLSMELRGSSWSRG